MFSPTQLQALSYFAEIDFKNFESPATDSAISPIADVAPVKDCCC